MKIKKIFYLLVILHLFSNNLYGLENKITLKVNDKIITSFDIKQEAKYLIVLNKNLKKIDQEQLNNLAKNSSRFAPFLSVIGKGKILEQRKVVSDGFSSNRFPLEVLKRY